MYIQDHTRFVNVVRFSPDGEFVCSGGADGEALILNGKTGERVSALGGSTAHSGGIYSVSCSMTASVTIACCSISYNVCAYVDAYIV